MCNRHVTHIFHSPILLIATSLKVPHSKFNRSFIFRPFTKVSDWAQTLQGRREGWEEADPAHGSGCRENQENGEHSRGNAGRLLFLETEGQEQRNFGGHSCIIFMQPREKKDKIKALLKRMWLSFYSISLPALDFIVTNESILFLLGNLTGSGLKGGEKKKSLLTVFDPAKLNEKINKMWNIWIPKAAVA